MLQVGECSRSKANRQRSGNPPAQSTAVFFARVHPRVPSADLLQLFSQYGVVIELNLFKRWPTARTSKGCGTVHFATSQAAAAALSALNGVHMFPGYDGPGEDEPMVVEWLDSAKQARDKDTAAHEGRDKDTAAHEGRDKDTAAHDGRDKHTTAHEKPGAALLACRTYAGGIHARSWHA
jgi:RNA recognition motif-containing protein